MITTGLVVAAVAFGILMSVASAGWGTIISAGFCGICISQLAIYLRSYDTKDLQRQEQSFLSEFDKYLTYDARDGINLFAGIEEISYFFRIVANHKWSLKKLNYLF